jgi:hypothetical protein
LCRGVAEGGGYLVGVTWIITAVAFIIAQALLMAVLVRRYHESVYATVIWGICVGCYTSVIMIVEACVSGPPLGEVRFLHRCVNEAWVYGLRLTDLRMIIYGQPIWLAWIELVLWMLPVTCCCAVRLKSERKGLGILFLVFAALPTLFYLYLVAVSVVAKGIYRLLGGDFGA